MSRETRLMVDQVIHDLQHRPEDFVCDKYSLRDGETGYQYWVANTVFDGGVYLPYEQWFGLIQSLRFHRALRKWKAWTMINAARKTA